MNPTCSTWGAISLSVSSHLLPMEGSLVAKPVTLPVGRAKFVTKPLPIGSPTPINKSGTVRTSACRIAVTKLVLATIRSGFRPINSTARARIWLAIIGGISNVDLDIASLRPTQLLKFLSKSRN